MNYSEQDIQAMLVAYFSKNEFKQADIKDAAGLKNQTEVSRLLRRAHDKGWIVQELRLPPDAEAEVKRRAYPKLSELKEKLATFSARNSGSTKKSVRVIHVNHAAKAKEKMALFGRLAAPNVAEILRSDDVRSCAIAWGRTVDSVVSAIPLQRKPYQEKVFVPISGAPFSLTDAITPSDTTRKLANAFRTKKQFSLHGVAARIPRELDDDSEVIRKYIMRWPDYNAIFKAKGGIISNLDMVLTGVGTVESSQNDPWFQETEKLEGIKDLGEVSVGNIGGIWLPRDQLNETHRERVDEINQRWLGIQTEHFEASVKRADEEVAPGVVVVAMEPSKAAIIARSMHLISTAIISDVLADELLRLPPDT